MIDLTKLTLNQLPLPIAELTEKNAALKRSNNGYKIFAVGLLILLIGGHIKSQIIKAQKTIISQQ